MSDIEGTGGTPPGPDVRHRGTGPQASGPTGPQASGPTGPQGGGVARGTGVRCPQRGRAGWAGPRPRASSKRPNRPVGQRTYIEGGPKGPSLLTLGVDRGGPPEGGAGWSTVSVLMAGWLED
jgi:hypothetical protein